VGGLLLERKKKNEKQMLNFFLLSNIESWCNVVISKLNIMETARKTENINQKIDSNIIKTLLLLKPSLITL
jgi:hypothetical protein